jgi:hypothetical protein
MVMVVEMAIALAQATTVAANPTVSFRGFPSRPAVRIAARRVRRYRPDRLE